MNADEIDIAHTPAHPLWRPFDPAATLDRRSRRIASRQVDVDGVVPFDPAWADRYEKVRRLLIGALPGRVLRVDHVGSTAVPGLAAKPILDVDLTVEDSSDEASYLPALEAAGFRLIARDSAWEEHRCLTYADPNSNVHVFSPGAIEPQRHLLFRDWLRRDDHDRERYGALKLFLAGRGFDADTDYNGRKAALVYEIYEHAFAHEPRFPHRAGSRSRAQLAD